MYRLYLSTYVERDNFILDPIGANKTRLFLCPYGNRGYVYI